MASHAAPDRASPLLLAGAALFAVFASACSDPCETLDDKLCRDLGRDCATYRADERIRGSFIPTNRSVGRRDKANKVQCEMFAADENYSRYTLPQAKYLVTVKRDPKTPRPALQPPKAVDGLYSGVSSEYFYALPVVTILLMLGYVAWYRRRLAKAAAAYPHPAVPGAQPGQQPGWPHPGPPGTWGQHGGGPGQGPWPPH